MQSGKSASDYRVNSSSVLQGPYLNQSEMFELGGDVRCMYTHHAHISSVALGGRNATMFHHPLKSSPFLSSITSIVPKSPCTVDQHLLGQ